mmetsp:Transcript_98556/g.195500  ORF Transcript_98556/g.195500 Transcript_98556/m.195500 type:complete len:81 (+) Transcript_98556:252-494(+)
MPCDLCVNEVASHTWSLTTPRLGPRCLWPKANSRGNPVDQQQPQQRLLALRRLHGVPSLLSPRCVSTLITGDWAGETKLG